MAKQNKPKRKYEKQLNRQLVENKEFLIKNLQEEWDHIQKTAKREVLIRRAKEGGMAMSKMFLALIAAGGIITIAAVAPNVFGAYGRLTKRRGFFDKNQFNKSKKYLLKQKYIRVVSRAEDAFEIDLTKKGWEITLKDTFNNLKITKTENWDGIWRIVIFDIPNRHKGAREGFREKLKELGFVKVQESVFAVPYPCDKEIKFLTSVFNVSNYVRIIRTQHLYDDADLKKNFNLA